MSQRTLVATAIVVTVLAAGAALAGAASERTADASVAPRAITVHGRPFFPVMLIDQCSAGSAARAHRLGVNLILNEHCPSTSAKRQLLNLSRRQVGVLDIRLHRVRGAKLLGWTYPDEPENNGWTPAKLAAAFPYGRMRRDGLLSFITTTSSFFRPPYRDRRIPASTTRRLARLADVAGFDLYPLNHCQQNLLDVYDAQRRFTRLAGARPTFQWIETGALRPSYCGGLKMTPDQLTAETWLAVVGGARGIGFFTHTWTPRHHAFDVARGVQRAMRRFADVASAVRPGLLGRTVRSGSNSPAIKVVARSGAGKTYVFAVNSLTVPVKVSIHVPRLRTGTSTVLGERRAVTVSDGRVVDSFAPLGVHVYVQPG